MDILDLLLQSVFYLAEFSLLVLLELHVIMTDVSRIQSCCLYLTNRLWEFHQIYGPTT